MLLQAGTLDLDWLMLTRIMSVIVDSFYVDTGILDRDVGVTHSLESSPGKKSNPDGMRES